MSVPLYHKIGKGVNNSEKKTKIREKEVLVHLEIERVAE